MAPEDTDVQQNLAKALLAAKHDNAPTTITQIFAGLLDIPETTVTLILLLQAMLESSNTTSDTQALPSKDELRTAVPAEFKTLLRANLALALSRAELRHVLEHEPTTAVYVDVAQLTLAQPIHICRGCPYSLRCPTEGLATPEMCHDLGPLDAPAVGTHRRWHRARLLKMLPTTARVSLNHPQGTWEVPYAAISLGRFARTLYF